MRILARRRLSRDTDESTSFERQREIITRWADLHEHTIVGWADDLDVSRSVDPFEAPGLGPWFEPGTAETWDTLAAWKLDRVAVGSIYLNRLLSWSQDHGKGLVSVTESFDLATWMGRMLANILASVAEAEWELIKDRTSASHQKIRELGRWHGGQTPYGYRAVQREGHPGWWLDVDPGQERVVHRVVTLYLTGWSPEDIARTLNEEGVPTGRPSVRRDGQAARWRGVVVNRLLRSPRLRGHAAHRGALVRDDDGLPRQFGPPLIDDETDARLQSRLAEVSRPKARQAERGLLTGIARCVRCGEALYFFAPSARGQTTYRCSTRVRYGRERCDAPGTPADQLEGHVEMTILDQIGELEIQDRIYVPGHDRAAELARVTEALSTVRQEYDLGLYEGDQPGYLRRVQSLSERRSAIEAEGGSEPRWELHGTGVTWCERWAATETIAERRAVLLDSGISVRAGWGPPTFHVDIPADQLERSFPGYAPEPERPTDPTPKP